MLLLLTTGRVVSPTAATLDYSATTPGAVAPGTAALAPIAAAITTTAQTPGVAVALVLTPAAVTLAVTPILPAVASSGITLPATGTAIDLAANAAIYGAASTVVMAPSPAAIAVSAAPVTVSAVLADDVTPPGTMQPIVTDAILPGPRQVEVMKLAFGPEGGYTVVENGAPLPITMRWRATKSIFILSSRIDLTTAGDHLIVSGTAGSVVRLFRVFLVAAAAVSLTFTDGTTPLHPPIPLAAGEAFLLALDGEPWFVTTAGAGLGLHLSAAVKVSGCVYYTKGS